MKIVAVLLVMFTSVISTRAAADGMVKLAAVYLSSSSGTDTQSSSSRTLIDMNPAYITEKGWAIGGIYAQEKISNSGGASISRTSLGPSIGWVTRKENGAFIMAHYLYSSELDTYKGDGYQADLGYKFKIRKISLGLQMSYKGFNYPKVNGTKISPPLKETKIDPYFALLIEF